MADHDHLHGLALDLRHNFGEYVYYASDKRAADVDDACAAWLHARGKHYDDIDGFVNEQPNRADIIAGSRRLLAATLDRATRDRLVYDYVVADARYNAWDDTAEDDLAAARTALIAYDDAHPDAAGHQVTL